MRYFIFDEVDMVNFFADNFSDCVFLAVFLLAMLPMVESKVAIPFALSVAIWGEAILSPTVAFFAAFLGCMLPTIFVILFGRFVKNKTSGFVHDKFLTKYSGKLEKIGLQKSTFRKCLTLATFVAVPLPLTGAWTGSLIAGLSNLKVWQSFISVLIGELISCGVVLLLCFVLENSAFYIFLISLALIAIFTLINLMMWMFGKIKNHKKNREIEIRCM